MKRLALACTLVALAVVLLVVGLVIRHEADFGQTAVQSQLASQGIFFTPITDLNPQQRKAPCLVANANRPLLTGAQAECYANNQIALDLDLFTQGKTYYQLALPSRQAQFKAEALAAKDPNNPRVAALFAESAKLNTSIEPIFQGEALRGMLLTSYGFSHLAAVTDEGADALFAVAGVFLLGALFATALAYRRERATAPDISSAALASPV